MGTPVESGVLPADDVADLSPIDNLSLLAVPAESSSQLSVLVPGEDASHDPAELSYLSNASDSSADFFVQELLQAHRGAENSQGDGSGDEDSPDGIQATLSAISALDLIDHVAERESWSRESIESARSIAETVSTQLSWGTEFDGDFSFDMGGFELGGASPKGYERYDGANHDGSDGADSSWDGSTAISAAAEAALGQDG
eukprot:COSAG05_NODE_7934_length_754_cov_1.233588_1_plen_199_part_01